MKIARIPGLFGLTAIMTALLMPAGCGPTDSESDRGTPENASQAAPAADAQAERKGEDESDRKTTNEQEGEGMVLEITSPAFTAEERIPEKYTGDGQDVSPPLAWSGLPDGTKELALICDDPDAPRDEPWVHWVIYEIPANVTGLPEGLAAKPKLDEPAGALQGENDFGNTGYGGPAPPAGHGTHHYHFKLYALATALDAKPGLNKDQLLKAMQGHILAEGELVGTYER